MQDTEVNLQRGDSGANVAYLQTLLSVLGYYNEEIDGVFDMPTEVAVKTLQADLNINIDGKVSGKLLSILEEAVNEAVMSRPGLKMPYSDVVLPWWVVSIIGGAGVFGVAELIRWILGKRKNKDKREAR